MTYQLSNVHEASEELVRSYDEIMADLERAQRSDAEIYALWYERGDRARAAEAAIRRSPRRRFARAFRNWRFTVTERIHLAIDALRGRHECY